MKKQGKPPTEGKIMVKKNPRGKKPVGKRKPTKEIADRWKRNGKIPASIGNRPFLARNLPKLWPVIVQDANTKDVLMLAYASPEALRKTKTTKYAWFHSRSRKKLWKKGETSGNTMRIKSVSWDCDKDSLLYKVEPAGSACHTGGETCFGPRAFSLEKLFGVLLQRKAAPPVGSYTAKLLQMPAFLNGKIMEEAEELTLAKTKREVAWEAADVLYFTLVKLVEKNVSLESVRKELERRR